MTGFKSTKFNPFKLKKSSGQKKTTNPFKWRNTISMSAPNNNSNNNAKFIH